VSEIRIGAGGHPAASGGVQNPIFRSYALRTARNENPHLAQKPSGLAVGDLLVIFVSGRNGLPTGTPSGFTKQWESSSATIVYAVSYSKVADASDVAASNFPIENNSTRVLFSCAYAIQNGGGATMGIANGVWASYQKARILYDTYSAPDGSLILFFAVGNVVEQFIILAGTDYRGYPVPDMRDFEDWSDLINTGCHGTITSAAAITSMTMNFQAAPIGAFICYILGGPPQSLDPAFSVSRDSAGILLAVRDNAAPQFAVSRDADGITLGAW